ncbi:carbohydrate kinase family protein [Lujinxingia litoralis]|nr:PfkB family carbohydrate kinase [Lujinxingia litoralis]
MRVLSVGYCTLDQIGVVEPTRRSENRRELSTLSVQGGGTAATAAVALARWGADVRFVGVVGDDERGRQIERTLSAVGVDTSKVVRRRGQISQLSMVMLDPELGRRLYVTPGNVAPLAVDDVNEAWLDGIDVLLVDGAYPQAQLLLARRARARGVRVVAELKGVARDVAEELLSLADVVVSSERVASDLSGVGALRSICKELVERGAGRAIITLGVEGAAGMDNDGELLREEARRIREVDVTGAGDVFLAGVVLGELHRWPLARTLAFANVAAARSCEGLGGRSSLTTREGLEAMLG